jgi:hypothetical protein
MWGIPPVQAGVALHSTQVPDLRQRCHGCDPLAVVLQRSMDLGFVDNCQTGPDCLDIGHGGVCVVPAGVRDVIWYVVIHAAIAFSPHACIMYSFAIK